MAQAAIHNGADAIYVGFPGYNARGRSVDLEVEELAKIIEACHLYGVRAYLALNVVIFQDELKKLIPLLERILPLKPDAVIVQDLGLAELVRKLAPAQALHASTQMTVTNHEAIALLEDLGFRRFVLGRENSLAEIALIKSKTDKDLEVFVHGALCVAYSGQCFTSESIGGRSANRGQCAQSCRFAYEMYVDGEKKVVLDKQYLLSPQDLCGIAEIPALMDLGVNSFKVEGRLKSAEYVASVAGEYRKAMDRHLQGLDLSDPELEQSRAKMGSVYSRGFFSGWLHGVDHQRLVDGAFSSNRGLRIGRVIEVRNGAMRIETDRDIALKPGDGVLWVAMDQRNDDEGGALIYEARSLSSGRLELRFGNHVDLTRVRAGSQLYLNHDSNLKKDLQKSFNDKHGLKKIPVKIVVEIELGQPLKASISDGRNECTALAASPVVEAKTKAVTDEFIHDELSALGGTVFVLKEFSVRRVTGQPIFYPHKELKELRRELTARLIEARSRKRIDGGETGLATRSDLEPWLLNSSAVQAAPVATKLNVLLREKAQVFDLIEAWQAGRIDRESLHSVILDFEFGADYEPAIRALKEARIRSGIATTRVLKPNEYTNLIRIERLAPDVILIRNLGALHYYTRVSPFAGELRGDFSLNVTNHLSARYLHSKGLKSVTASYDLNSRQVHDLLAATDAARVEVTVHQYMPSFHMEHCVFAAFLSSGSSFRDCGKPCEKHRVELKDQFGHRHEIKADQECRNTMFNANSQSASRFVREWQTLGLGVIRYEALYERGVELIKKISAYQDLLKGTATSEQIIADLKLFEKYGLGEGAIGKNHEYQSRKKSQ
jgi:putative protease